MNAENLIKTMWSPGVPKFLKKHKLKMLQDNACLHTSVATENFMKKKNVTVEFTPPTSPDIKVVKKLFLD